MMHTDPKVLIAQLAELASGMSAQERQSIADELHKAGFGSEPSGGANGGGGAAGGGGTAALPEAPARAVQQALGHGPRDGLDVARLLELEALLIEFAGSLDQVVWNTWKAVAPTSAIKRTNSVKVTMAKFAAGDQEIQRAQVKQDLERLRQLTAALTASVNQAGRSFAQRHIERFAPTEIESMARMSSAGLLVGHEVKCWRKYVELAGPVDAQAIERDLHTAIATYAESLMKGVGGR